MNLCLAEDDSTGGDSLSILTPEVNHLYVVLAPSSIDSIAKTPFIAETFASFEQRFVDAGEDSWSGTYLIGRKAYLEFFGAGIGFEGASEGVAGLGLSTQKIGEFPKAKESLLAVAGDRSEDGLRERILNNDTIPWYNWLSLKESDSISFSAWLMESREEYLNHLGIELDSSRSFSRKKYLEKKVDSSTVVSDSSNLFDDLVEIDLELNENEATDFELFLKALGIDGNIVDGSVSFATKNCVVNVRRSENPGYRIVKIICSLTGAVEKPISIQFGPDARLDIRDKQAVWSFN